MRRVMLVVLLAPLLMWQVAPAQGVVGGTIGGVPYVEAGSLARRLGVVMTALDGVLTWRGEAGVATFFAGNAEALVQAPGDAGPTEHALSAPVVLRDGSWFLPLDAAPLLGVNAVLDGLGARLEFPDGQSVTLESAALVGTTPAADGSTVNASTPGPAVASWERTEIGPGVPALRFFAGDSVSLLLVDLDLAPLAFPAMTATIDEAAEAAGADHALFLIVTALEPTSWATSIRFTQDGRSLEARHPYRLRLHVGAAGTVAPGSPVAGVALLPTTFTLYRPMEVEWGGAKAVITFRK